MLFEHVEDTSETDGIFDRAAAEVLRVLNIDAQDFIEDICQPAYGDYTMALPRRSRWRWAGKGWDWALQASSATIWWYSYG